MLFQLQLGLRQRAHIELHSMQHIYIYSEIMVHVLKQH
jgi:hypothetical protein